MTSKNELILQSFYPNKLSYLLSSIVCAAFSAVFFHLIKNPGTYSGSYRAELWNNLPIEIQYLIFLFLIFFAFVLLLPLLFPESIYVRITNRGIIYKSPTTIFQEARISWKVIDNFFIYSFPANESTKFVKIKFKKKYMPNFVEKNLVIFGNPNKVLNIVKDYLMEYSKKDPK